VVSTPKEKNEEHPVLKNADLFYKRLNEIASKHPNPKENYFGAAPNIFIGKKGYPNLNVGFLSNEHVDASYDSPKLWYEQKYDIPQIVSKRSYLVNSNFTTHIKSFDDRFMEKVREIALSSKPVDVEVSLTKKPHYKLEVGPDITPYGPSIKLKKAEITENAKVPQKVEKVYSQDDFRAQGAIEYLSDSFDEHYLTKLLSGGTLGLKSQRKLVPTRWSITAVDDMLGKKDIKKIRDYPNRTDYEVYTGEYMGNFYFIMFFPELWSYELFETYMPNDALKLKEIKSFTDFEGYGGRKEYAYNTMGGYYAARIGVTEHLSARKKQGAALLLRFVTDDYWVPLGVWVVRQTVRTTLANKPLVFGSKDLMIKYAQALIKKKFGYDVNKILSESKLLKYFKSQTKLFDF